MPHFRKCGIIRWGFGARRRWLLRTTEPRRRNVRGPALRLHRARWRGILPVAQRRGACALGLGGAFLARTSIAPALCPRQLLPSPRGLTFAHNSVEACRGADRGLAAPEGGRAGRSSAPALSEAEWGDRRKPWGPAASGPEPRQGRFFRRCLAGCRGANRPLRGLCTGGAPLPRVSFGHPGRRSRRPLHGAAAASDSSTLAQVWNLWICPGGLRPRSLRTAEPRARGVRALALELHQTRWHGHPARGPQAGSLCHRSVQGIPLCEDA